MWNSLNLKCPVSDICEYGLQDGLVLQDLPNLVTLLTTSAEVLTKDNPIWTEIKVFHNIQAKYKRILHCDKCLLLLQRVGGCLRKMVLLNLSKSYLDLAEHLLIGLQNQTSKIYLPSKQQLEFVLIRTQTAARLICEALHYSRETFCYLIQRLKLGHIILNLVMATSVTARVNILFKGILVQLFDLYRQLYSWHNKLKKGTWEWPQELKLPEDLEEWLQPEVSELLKPKNIPKEQLDFLTQFFKKTKNTDHTESDSDSVIEMPVDNEISILSPSTESAPTEQNADCGEVIARIENNLPNEESTSSVKLTKSQKLLLNQIKGVKALKKLIMLWNNLNVSSPDLIPISLTPAKIRMIDKMFDLLKIRMRKIKTLSLPSAALFKEKESIVKLGALKFAKHLGLIAPREAFALENKSTDSDMDLKPVKTFKGLKNLYQSLYKMLQSTQQYEKCEKLKKVFKSRKADIKLLMQSNERTIARKLIFCTSKVFLTRFKK